MSYAIVIKPFGYDTTIKLSFIDWTDSSEKFKLAWHSLTYQPIKQQWKVTVVSAYYTVSQKSIPNIFDCKLKTNYQILIILGTNIPDTTCHQMTIQFPTSANVCFCTTWGKHNQQSIIVLSNAMW